MLALIRGAGDLASGIALRLWRSGIAVVMTDLPRPTVIRRTVSFADAITNGTMTVEDVTARFAADAQQAQTLLAQGVIPVLADPECICREKLKPDVTVDAILAKRNLGTRITDAPIVIGVGPGFTAGQDCHAVVETMRGHTLGRVLYQGGALPNTNVPGLVGGFAGERVLRAPVDGVFEGTKKIRDLVQEGDIVGYVAGVPVHATISGVLRGLIADGVEVKQGMKSGDIDPRGEVSYCDTVSDKANAVAGGVLEAILHLSGALREKENVGGEKE